MKSLAYLIVIVTLAVAAAGQVATEGDDISVPDYFAIYNKANDLLTEYYPRRVTIVEEFTKDRSVPIRPFKKTVREFIAHNNWREVEETYGTTTDVKERVFYERQIYVRTANGAWTVDTNRSIIVGGHAIMVKARDAVVRRVLSIDFEGQKADFYDASLKRDAYTFICKGIGECESVKVPYQERITSWFLSDGRILKWVSETNRGAPNVLSRMTITYEYNPKDLKIEAPIK